MHCCIQRCVLPLGLQGTTTAGLVRLLSPAAEDFAAGQRSVELICTDVDGTLLDARQRLTPGVQRAVQARKGRAAPPSLLARRPLVLCCRRPAMPDLCALLLACRRLRQRACHS